MVSFVPRQIYLEEKTPVPTEKEGSLVLRAGLDVLKKKKKNHCLN
jgi:hypothetical protein